VPDIFLFSSRFCYSCELVHVQERFLCFGDSDGSSQHIRVVRVAQGYSLSVWLLIDQRWGFCYVSEFDYQKKHEKKITPFYIRTLVQPCDLPCSAAVYKQPQRIQCIFFRIYLLRFYLGSQSRKNLRSAAFLFKKKSPSLAATRCKSTLHHVNAFRKYKS
jgi:hypothetical protein